jgi:hypothetical protein
VLSGDVRISGVPWLSLDMSSSKPKANLTGVLVDYAPDGTATILTRGWLDPENRDSAAVTEPVTPGTFYRLRFDMQPKDSVITAGHRIGVMILSSDNEATIRPAPGTQLTMDLARSSVHLPVVGGAAALAEATGAGTTSDQIASGLLDEVAAAAGQTVASGPGACDTLASLARTITTDTTNGGLSAGQAATLNESLSQIRPELGC